MRLKFQVLLLATALVVPFAGLWPSAVAQERAYAPEDLRTLSRRDQARVIGKEYSEQSGGRSLPDDQLEFYLDQVNRSNWGFSDVKRDIAKSLAGSGAGPGAGADGGDPGTVSCASDRFRFRECPTRFRGPVRLVRNVSKTRCVEGQNWGSGPGMVWVDKGCQGQFAAAQAPSVPRPTPGGYTVTCASDHEQNRTCVWDISQGRPILVQQLSSAPCVEGRTWRYEDGRVWVLDGCRARFGVAGAGAGRPPLQSQATTCTSKGHGSTAWCPWDQRRGRPQLRQELSFRRCSEGQTWGYAPTRGIWVADGCSARFDVR